MKHGHFLGIFHSGLPEGIAKPGYWPRLTDFPGQWLRQCLLQSPGATGVVFRDPI